jgi:putative cardiolipin synthase
MRSKSFTADGIATIIGGRNIDDEYFGVTDDVATGIALVHSGYARRRVELLSGGVELF